MLFVPTLPYRRRQLTVSALMHSWQLHWCDRRWAKHAGFSREGLRKLTQPSRLRARISPVYPSRNDCYRTAAMHLRFLVFNGSIEQHNYRSTCGARFDTYALELKAAQRAIITVIIQRLPAFLREGEARATELGEPHAPELGAIFDRAQEIEKAISDFEFEQALALMERNLRPNPVEAH